MISVRQTRGLPPPFFRFRLTTDTLGLGCNLPAAGRFWVFHPLECALSGRTRKTGAAIKATPAHHCPGCFNQIAWDFTYGKPFTQDTIDLILDMLKPAHIKGLTLLGGEPFEPQNQRDVIELLRQVKKHYPKKSIWAFSGYLFDRDMLSGRLGDLSEYLSYLMFSWTDRLWHQRKTLHFAFEVLRISG